MTGAIIAIVAVMVAWVVGYVLGASNARHDIRMVRAKREHCKGPRCNTCVDPEAPIYLTPREVRQIRGDDHGGH